ncbi:MAG: hypothetical protein Q9167_000801 [Letrouitia subvulpina]
MSSFEEAAASFRKRLSVENIQDFQNVQNIGDLTIAIRAIESEQSRRKAFRNLNRLRPFVNSLNDYARVIEVFVTCKPDILGLIWGPVKFCLQIASKSVKAFDALLDAYRRIGESIPVVSGIGNAFKSDNLVKQVLGNVYEDILLFHKRAVSFFKRTGWEMLWQLTSRTLDDLFGDVIANLSRSKQLLFEAANVAHYSAANDDRMILLRRIETENQIEDQRRKIFVQEWLSAISCEDIHNELRELRGKFPGTTEWVHENELLRRWLKEPLGDQLFWLSGIPGAGESSLGGLDSIVDHLGQKFPDDTVVYFYCKHNDEARNQFSEIVRSLISQLTWNNPVCLEYLHTKILSIGASRTTCRKTYHELAQALVQGHCRLFFCIDGLDECEDTQRREILNLILRLREVRIDHSQLRFLVAACAERDIEQSLRNPLKLELTKLHLNSDITLYLTVMAGEVSRKFAESIQRVPSAFAAAIFNKVVSRPEGMFLLATLIMENLLDQESIEDLEEELRPDVLPRGIDQAYGRIVFRIRRISKPKQLERIKSIFELLLTARRTLKLYEIQGALTVDTTNQSVDFEQRRLHNIEDFIKEKCGPIVKIAGNKDVELVHSSAKSFLHDLDHGLIQQKWAELNMASICLASVSSLLPAMKCAADLVTKAHQGKFVFQEYAILNWLHHLKYIKELKQYPAENIRHLEILAQDLIKRELDKDATPRREEPNLEDHDEFQRDISHQLRTALEKQNAVRTLSSSSIMILTTEDASFQEEYLSTIPNTFALLSRCRDAIEYAFEEQKGDRHLLLSAYGNYPFKCRVVACRRFILGYRSRKLRDDHLRTHERSFKCTERGCDFVILGFPSQRALELHISLSHESNSKVVDFPNLKPQTIWTALQAAVDDNDCDAVRQLSLEAQAVEGRPKGLLLRALTKGYTEVASVLIDHFSDKAELHYAQSNGDNSFYRAAKLGDLSLFKRLLELTENTLPERKTTKYNAVIAAAGEGSIEILSLIYRLEKRTVLEYENPAALQAVKVDQEVALKFFDKVKSFTQVRRRELLKTAVSNGSKSCVKYLLHKYGIPKEYTRTEVEDLPSKNVDEAVEKFIKSNNPKMHQFLRSAVNAGDIAKAENLLEQGANVNYCSDHSDTLLFEATSVGNEPIVRFLLDNKADVSLQQSFKDLRSLLDVAFKNASYSLMSLLVDSGAKFSLELEKDAVKNAVNLGDERMIEMLLNKENHSVYSPICITTALTQAVICNNERIVRLIMLSGLYLDHNNDALQIAAMEGHELMVRLLLNLGMKGNNWHYGYGTALQCASVSGHDTIVRLLIQQGVNVNQKDTRGKFALWMASERGHEKIVQLLLDNGADPNLQREKMGAALHIATKEGHVTIMRSLIERGAAIETVSWEYGTPLYAASKHKSSMAIEVLLENGADPNTASDEYGGALYSASENNSLAALQLLLEAGANIHVSVTRHGKAGCTPLQVAARQNHKDVVRMLIENGADVNNKASIDGSALYVASENGYIEIMQQLLDSGANLSARDLRSGATSLTPLQIASKCGHESAVRLLLDHGADSTEYDESFIEYTSALEMALTEGNVAIIELLLERGANTSEKENSPALYWALQIASENNHETIVELLLNRGVNPNGGISDGLSLHLASKQGHTGVVRRLLDAGANIFTAPGMVGLDPLLVASKNGHDDVVRLLLERGNNPDARVSLDKSLYLAVANRHDKVVELLLKFGADADHPDTRLLAWQNGYGFLDDRWRI